MAKQTSPRPRRRRPAGQAVRPRLGSKKILAFLATTDPGRAKPFFRDTLGLRLLSEDPFALVFDAGGTRLRVATVRELASAPYTVLGWEVANIEAVTKDLRSAGVKFEHYSGMQQDELGIWKSPSGARVAWFKDPDGNTLSLGQH